MHKTFLILFAFSCFLSNAQQRKAASLDEVLDKFEKRNQVMGSVAFSKNGIQTATANHFKLSLTQAKSQEIKFINKLNGYINFISQVKGKDDKIGELFRTQYNALVSNYFL